MAGFDFFSNFFLYCNILISFRMRIAIYSIGTIRYKVLWILFVNTSDSLLDIKSNSLHIDYTEIKFIGRTNHIVFAWYWTYFFLPLCFRLCNYMRWRRTKLITRNKMNLWSHYEMHRIALTKWKKKKEKKNSTKKRRNKEILIIFFIQRENMVAIRQTVDIELSWLLIAFYMSTSNDIGSRKTEWSGASVAFIVFASGKHWMAVLKLILERLSNINVFCAVCAQYGSIKFKVKSFIVRACECTSVEWKHATYKIKGGKIDSLNKLYLMFMKALSTEFASISRSCKMKEEDQSSKRF